MVSKTSYIPIKPAATKPVSKEARKAAASSTSGQTHPWRLVAPWYRWARAGVPADGRNAPPSIQKFSSDDFVNEFIKNPQHSLKFDADIDQVYSVHYEAVPGLVGQLQRKVATLYPNDAHGNKVPSRTKLAPTGIRKLFLPTHSRHYLVVCELHCDFADFPSPKRDEACQAGFVVRRKYLSYPESARPAAVKLLKEISALQAKLSELDQTAPLRPRAAKRRAEKLAKMKADGSFYGQRAELAEQLYEARKALQVWKSEQGVYTVNQGWIPSEHDRIGSWQIVEDEPQSFTEAAYPLLPLVADRNDPNHDATGRTMYFGLVPASSFDSDADGKSRYDDDSFYEIRCFVRRHKDRCPRKLDAVPDCQGELIWSLPTERYKLAAQFDLEGTSNRPVTIKMPNLAELAAQAVKRPFGKYSPVKFIQPQGLNPRTNGMGLGGGSMGGFQICFFSIPLITIVALFVLNIFLPIVVSLFGLWFLLAFKFCIPPTISIDAGLQAELDVVGQLGLNVDADFSVDVDFQVTEFTADQLNGDLHKKVKADIATTYQLPINDVGTKLGTFANSPLMDLNSNNAEIANLPQNAKDDPPIIDFAASLEYEEHRDVGDVVKT
jgi:hypothetical protein